ncbi:MAG: glutaredoxin family protein [Methyloprofundus sp.]|nr:glutaredoxin family protein [Methyloprofundus sp.]MBW6452940.1 glutaredoxin family protein [Methyloprofundus sp.]
MSQLVLLGTSACHLCEQAEALVMQLNIPFTKIDIAEQEQWQKRYAIRIPVLVYLDTKKELAWPFGSEDILTFVGATPPLPCHKT